MKHFLKNYLPTFLLLVFVQISTAQTWSEQQIINSPNSTIDHPDKFGDNVYIVGDLAVVGNIYDPQIPNQKGSVTVYNFIAGTWTETTTLAAPYSSNGWFGYDVSISETKDRILVSDPSYDDSILGVNDGRNVGAAFIYEFEAGNWVLKAMLKVSNPNVSDRIGYSVSISGNVAVIGAPRTDPNGNDSGSAYIFEYDGSNWIEKAQITPFDGSENSHFGHSVSTFGNRILVGAYGDRDSQLGGFGSAYIFEKNNNNWEQTAKLNGRSTNPKCDRCNCNFFGWSVALTEDRAIIGAHSDKEKGVQSGAAFIFEYTDFQWVQVAKLTASDAEENALFGESVSISGDMAIVGSPAGSISDLGKNHGAAYIFNYESGVWIEKTKLTASNGKDFDSFGSGVGISGTHAIVGAPRERRVNGSVYTFGLSMFTGDDEMIKDTQEDYTTILSIRSKDKIGIYPNPANDVLNVYTYDADAKNIKILSLDGTIAKTFQMNQSKNVNISDLSSGMYFLQIEKNNEIVRQKFMVL